MYGDVRLDRDSLNQGEYIAAILNLLRLEEHLQILSPGCGSPLKIVPWKIDKIGLCLRTTSPGWEALVYGMFLISLTQTTLRLTMQHAICCAFTPLFLLLLLWVIIGELLLLFTPLI